MLNVHTRPVVVSQSNTVTVFLMDKTSQAVHLTAGNKTTVQQINQQILTVGPSHPLSSSGSGANYL